MYDCLFELFMYIYGLRNSLGVSLSGGAFWFRNRYSFSRTRLQPDRRGRLQANHWYCLALNVSIAFNTTIELCV